MTHNYYLITPPLQVPLKLLSWRHSPDMPFEMSEAVQSVVVEGTVYVGGGDAWLESVNNYNVIVMTYDISTGKWATLPPYRACDFAMTTINNQLVLVGGYELRNSSKVLGVWDTDNKQWTHPYPEMHTARTICSAIVYKEWLVVAGGWTAGGSLSSVEVMNTTSKQWYAGPPTPKPWSCMRTAVVGDTCYFMGGVISGGSTDKVYTVSLSALTSGLTSKEPRKKWREISGLHLTDFTPLFIRGSLIAVGGRNKDCKAVTAIHLYQPDTGKWVKVGDLPTPRWDCICAKITDKEMLVAGGYDGEKTLKSTDIALLK